jgi:hypothetical protein
MLCKCSTRIAVLEVSNEEIIDNYTTGQK